MNPVITSRTVTGPGLKSRPMATYCTPSQRAIQRAKAAAAEQREQRERAEALSLLAAHGFEPQPPAPEMPATLPVWQQPEPDPLLTHDFILGLLTGAMLASATVALLLGGRS